MPAMKYESCVTGTKLMACAAIAVAAHFAACSTTKAVVLSLQGDATQTTDEISRTAADALVSTLNDPFAYNPASPTSPLPFQVINTNADALKGYNGRDSEPITVAYTFGATDGLFFDLYGRNNCCFERDNNLTIELFNGDWTTPVSTTTGFTIDDSAPYHGRFTAPAGITADRIRFTGPMFFTLMEIRGNGNTGAGVPIWAANVSGDWYDTNKWFNGLPNGVGAQAVFGSVITSPQTIYTNTQVTLGSLTFNNAGGVQIAGQGSLSLSVSSGNATIDVLQGSQKLNLPLHFVSDTNVNVAEGAVLTISNPAVIQAGVTVNKTGTVVVQAPLTIEAGGVLNSAAGALSIFGAADIGSNSHIDLNSSALDIDYRGQSTPASTVRAQLASGYNGGTWDGDGINTSAAVAGQSGLGWVDDTANKSIKVRLVQYGDANLDGTVDSVDFSAFVSGYGNVTTGIWAEGDFDYDQKVNTVDFNMLAGSFGQSMPSAALGSVVPEPSSLAMLALLAMSGFARRRSN